jgi:hypothetical protein
MKNHFHLLVISCFSLNLHLCLRVVFLLKNTASLGGINKTRLCFAKIDKLYGYHNKLCFMDVQGAHDIFILVVNLMGFGW